MAEHRQPMDHRDDKMNTFGRQNEQRQTKDQIERRHPNKRQGIKLLQTGTRSRQMEVNGKGLSPAVERLWLIMMIIITIVNIIVIFVIMSLTQI